MHGGASYRDGVEYETESGSENGNGRESRLVCGEVVGRGRGRLGLELEGMLVDGEEASVIVIERGNVLLFGDHTRLVKVIYAYLCRTDHRELVGAIASVSQGSIVEVFCPEKGICHVHRWDRRCLRSRDRLRGCGCGSLRDVLLRVCCEQIGFSKMY